MCREQKLIDACFQLVLTSHRPEYNKHFQSLSMERKAAWVAGQLRELGVDTVFLMKPYYVIKALGDVPGSGFSEE